MSRLLTKDIESATTPTQKDRTNCLITEVVVPGFAWQDHQYLTLEGLQEIFKDTENGAETIQEFAPFIKSFN
jgi:predicted cupin superfamily sugar epimerase